MVKIYAVSPKKSGSYGTSGKIKMSRVASPLLIMLMWIHTDSC